VMTPGPSSRRWRPWPRRGPSCCARPRGALRPAHAHELAAGEGFSLLCGRYEGIDQRVADHLCDDESRWATTCSPGRGRGPRVVEAVARLVPGVMATRSRPIRSRSPVRPAPAPCSSTPSTHGPPSSGASACPRSCARATTVGRTVAPGQSLRRTSSGVPTCSTGRSPPTRAPPRRVPRLSEPAPGAGGHCRGRGYHDGSARSRLAR